MTALIVCGMFPAVTLIVAGLARAEQNLDTADAAQVRPAHHLPSTN